MITTKRIAQAGIAVAAIGVGAATFKTTYIDADGGGDIAAYNRRYDKLYKDGVHVVVRGNCYSSCTMVLGYPNSCLEKDAVLGFHPGYVPYLLGLAHYTISVEGTNVMRAYYPSDALEVIDRHHGLDNKGGWLRPQITLIKGSEFPHRYQC